MGPFHPIGIARLTDQPPRLPLGHGRGQVVADARVFAGRVERVGDLLVFRGMPSWTYGRGGVCVGRCYLTGANVSRGVLEHEAVHARQWRRYGFLMPLLYLLAGRNALRNRFEIEAGLVRGGYVDARYYDAATALTPSPN